MADIFTLKFLMDFDETLHIASTKETKTEFKSGVGPRSSKSQNFEKFYDLGMSLYFYQGIIDGLSPNLVYSFN